MEVLHICPANFATGGTESIHQLVSAMNRVKDVHARILYTNWNRKDTSQPKEYVHYECEYITEFPSDFKGCVIFPEVYGNDAVKPQYKDCVVAMNWAGVDVYDWNVPKEKRGIYLQRKDMIHIARSKYAMDTLTKKGLKPIEVACTVSDEFFEPYEEEPRWNTVLYNGVGFKLTPFQKAVIEMCKAQYHIKFLPLINFKRPKLIEIMRRSKLYIDFGEFSGRERLPREAALCGCCVLTSNLGAAGYFEDVAISDRYKFDDTQLAEAVERIREIIRNYPTIKTDFDEYRISLCKDREIYPKQVKELCDALFNNYSRL